MAPRTPRRRATPNVSELHRAWLELVDTDGPFLAIAPLKRVWPQGMPALDDERKEALLYARKDFEAAWETADRATGNDGTTDDAYRIARDKWVETVLRDVVGWAESLSWGPVAGITAQSPNRAVTVGAEGALLDPDGAIGALVSVIDPVDSLRQVPSDLWAATPVDRMEALLRDNDIPIGIVTDGRWWALVCARAGAMTASGVVDALTWVEETRTRDAFLTLISRQHIIGGKEEERLPVLFEESVAAAEEITEALGAQVRRAVELLIQSFSESARDAHQRGEPDPLPADTHQSYEAAVTIMMRIVFLLFAEERGLLPSGELFEQGYGISHELDRLQAREAEESEEALDATSLTWHRLLATSQALYGGASFENMRVPAYGGSLFDPDRFPFLTGLTAHGTLAITVSDRVMLHTLRSVQQAVLKGGEARRISFRDIDVEQIGYIYEGLLGYTAVTVAETHLGLQGTRGEEPEITLSGLERLAATNTTPKKLAEAIRAHIEDDQPSAKPHSVAAISKNFGAQPDPSVVSGLAQAVGDDTAFREHVLPWLGIMRQDLRGRPFVVLTGGLMVKETPSRKNAGAHYTPKSLAREVVLHALQPLCYSPGPYQTADESQWRLKSSDDLLSLKVADIACGSGAFLVSAASYLADRVVEAWTAEDSANAHRSDLHRRAIRVVVANCLYGADINDMAVEMCKLSLWLVSLDRDLPFSFVDDKVFLGNSLLGITSLHQLRRLHIDPSRVPVGEMFDIFNVDIDAVIQRAAELRRKLATEIDENDPARNSAAKRRQLEQLQSTTADLRKIADGIVAAGLPLGGKPGKALDEAYENLRAAVKAAFPNSGTPDPAMLNAIIERGLRPTVDTDYEYWLPNHWVLAAPDVIVDRGGFDAIVGNPPFLAGKKIAVALGPNCESWFKADLGGQKGSADLCAHFFRRAWSLLTRRGSVGLIGTDRIGQGDTAHMSTAILAQTGRIFRAVTAFRWPGKVATGASIVWATKESVGMPELAAVLDNEKVRSITSSLSDGGRADLSHASKLPAPFRAGNGVSVYGEGFFIRAQDPILADLSDQERQLLRPFVNGQSFLSGVSSGVSVIDVNRFETEEEVFTAAPTLASHLRRTVKPVRDAITSQIHEVRYWAYWDKREDLISDCQSRDRFIVLARMTRVPTFMFSTDVRSVFSDQVVLIASDSAAVLGVLSSIAHIAWFEATRTNRGSTSYYVVSRCLRTFPFPHLDEIRISPVAESFISARNRALARFVSTTKLYNAVDDPKALGPDIRELRDAHVALDRVVLDGYGWKDLSPKYGFFEIAGVRRFACSEEDRSELRRRLLEENHRQASGTVKPEDKVRRGKKAADGQGTLL
ncbi:Eco57I restriction-modification methylase domain-containing protein [Mycobacterium sp. NPDC050041]|uniref:Eco57I restriction-modification methylase domain-containing protein n=1 Tax=Mycobacterium sp. NPDC050041 TaxID=3364293 RepID=UPI003C2CD103